jgi:hypothetical protein
MDTDDIVNHNISFIKVEIDWKKSLARCSVSAHH